VSTQSKAKGETSNYTVRPGDHLFHILMHRYGLSNTAAEMIIPEIMRLSGIQKPENLSVGQRLTIPLPLPSDTATQSRSKNSRNAPQPESAVEPPRVTRTPHMREIVARPSQPCLLAREVAEQLGVRIPSLSPLLNAESISVYSNEVKMAVVCDLSPAETYTLERLLAQQGAKILVLKADEMPRMVVEELVGRLKILFQLSNADTASNLPLTYLFPDAIAGEDLWLTIRPDVPASK
jgi:hypothetical protein